MRWYLIDKYVEFESGRRAVAVKSVAAAEEALDGYMPGFLVMPASLIIEGIAHTGGLLVGEVRGYQERVVLAKVGKAVFHRTARPGDTLTYTTVIEDIKPDGAIVKATSYIGSDLQADVDMVFAHLDDDRFAGVELFEPADFLRMLRGLGIYDVGRDQNGNRLQVPSRLLAAEQADQQ
jgi:3-hydroxyacyl-[acyl-carrier-protein] dehydratase